MTKIALDAQALSEVAVQALQEIKGKNIVRMDLRKSDGSVTDFFIICTGTSNTHVQALADSVLKVMKKEAFEIPFAKEGVQAGEWVLVDYVNVVVHIFLKDKREFYQLERLWGDAKVDRFEDM
ncbi:MAG: ribosome silencing factor [Bacteroidia bacterium]|nr:ribosome silencing factor [Bacteroidia bacterium]